jgi:hypothetical protein
MFVNSAFVIGTICLSLVFTGFNANAGLVAIQPDTLQNRKNARRFSSFFRAAKFLFGHDARNALTSSTVKSETNTKPLSAANCFNCLKNLLVSNVRCTNTLDDVSDGTNYAKVSAAALFLGQVKSAQVSNQAVGQQTLSSVLCQGSPGTNLVFSGWKKVATTTINVPAGTLSIVLNALQPSQPGGGAGSQFTGVGFAVYVSVDPGTPQVFDTSGAGTHTLTLSNPATGNGLTLALYIQGDGLNDGLSTSPNGSLSQTVVQILNAGSLT